MDHNSKFHDAFASASWDPYKSVICTIYGEIDVTEYITGITGAGCGSWRTQLQNQGSELAIPPGVSNINIVQLGTYDETSIAGLPSYIVLDRLYIHGDPVSGALRGVLANSSYTNIVNCYISDIKHLWADSQAIESWNGSGPFQIINNYLEAAGENIMFGGGLASIANLVPSNILIRHNHIFKPLSWKKDDPTYAGTAWIVKNSFEIKNPRHVRRQCNRKLLADGTSRYGDNAYASNTKWGYAVGRG